MPGYPQSGPSSDRIVALSPTDQLLDRHGEIFNVVRRFVGDVKNDQ